MTGEIDFLIHNIPNLLIGFPKNRPGGLLMTCILSLIGLSSGLALGAVIASGLQSRFIAIRSIAKSYVQLVRGVPLVLELLIVHQALTAGWFGFHGSSLVSASITLALYCSSYQADIIASGMRSVPKSVIENARLLGASPLRCYLQVSLPHSLRVMRPALVSQAVTVFKDSSVVVVLGVADLTTTARVALGSDVSNAPYWVTTYLAVGFLYFIVAYAISLTISRGAYDQQRLSISHS